MAEIVLDRVGKHYPGGARVLDEVSFTIHAGEFFILVGPSGCGKSTLLNMIVGLEDISAGEIRVDGQRVNELDPKDRNMAMVFQSYALYPHLSVRDNLAFPLRLAGVAKDEIRRRVEAVADTLELGALLDRKPAKLSGGQRQRVAMGRAMVRRPRVFLLDEPLSNLDARLRVQMRGEIGRLHQQWGVTTIYVTHDQTEAMILGDRVAVLHGGRLQQVGTPRELYERPGNRFVAGFLGSPAMSFFPGLISDGRLALPMGETRQDFTGEIPGNAQRVILGIRPEHLRVAEGARTDIRFTATIDRVEWLGAELFLQVRWPLPNWAQIPAGDDLWADTAADRTALLTARADPHLDLRAGDRVELGFNSVHLRGFDAVSGLAVALPSLGVCRT